MKITLQKAELAKAISLTQSVVERRTTMPILSNVLLTAESGEFRISATDLEITAVVRLEGSVEREGRITVSSKVLSEIVRELPDGEVSLSLEDAERLEITAGTANFRMLGVSADEFPSLPGVGLAPKAKIDPAILLEMVNRTIYAVSQDETRFNLNGVCFEIPESNTLRLVATDGHRLAMIDRPVDGLAFEGSVIVPTKGLLELRKALSSSDTSNLAIDLSEGFFVFETDKVKLATRVIDGEFPDYNQVLPKEEGVNVHMLSHELAQALRRTALMVTDKGKCVRFDFSNSGLRLSSSSPELGEASDDLSVDYSGEDLSVGFNAKYVLDILSSVGDGSEVVIALHGELGPGKFSVSSDESFLGIVMPMRLN